MHFDIAGAFGRHLNNVQAASGSSQVHCLAELFPVLDPLKPSAEHLHRETKVQSRRRAKKLLKMLWIGCLWQEGEDTPAIVIDKHDSQVKPVQAGGKQPVEIVEKREIAKYQHS